MTGEIAWAAMGFGILAYEVFAPDDQLLSEAVDRFLMKHPHLTRMTVLILAAHLLNMIPNRYDPIHHTAIVVRLQRKQLDRLTMARTITRRPAIAGNQAYSCPVDIGSKAGPTQDDS